MGGELSSDVVNRGSKNRLLFAHPICLFSVIVCLGIAAAAQGDPIEISTLEELQAIGQDPNFPIDGDYVLMNDIDGAPSETWNDGRGFVPIRGASLAFAGTFDGQGHAIHDLHIDDSQQLLAGLFYNTSATASIHDLRIVNIFVTAQQNTGALVGRNQGTIARVSATGRLVGKGDIGGLVGDNRGTIEDCYAACVIDNTLGQSRVGGLVGSMFLGGVLRRSYASSTSINHGSSTVGGLVGLNNNSFIYDSYARGWGSNPSSDRGGLVGSDQSGYTENCYAITRFELTGFPSGLIKSGSLGTQIVASFWDRVYTGISSSNGGTSRTTAAMQRQTNYDPPWDFEETWAIVPNRTYPYHQRLSTYIGGSIVSPDGGPIANLRVDASILNHYGISKNDGSFAIVVPKDFSGTIGFPENAPVEPKQFEVSVDGEPVEGFAFVYTPPTVTLTGESELIVDCTGALVDPGATAVDGQGNDLTDRIVITGNPDFSQIGEYFLTYRVTDDFNVTSLPVTRTVQVVDTTPPVVTVTGDSLVELACGAPYFDLGATAEDACDGEVDVSVSGSVAINVAGDYEIRYTAVDASGNEGVATRIVRRVDLSDPVIGLNGPTIIDLECGTPYSEPGITVFDDCSAPTTPQIEGMVDVHTPGNYILTYTISDGAGQPAQPANRLVRVADTTPPTILLMGGESIVVECGATFADPGVEVLDACEGALVAEVDGMLDTNTPGEYVLVYSAADSQGNLAETVVRTVSVVDREGPEISLIGADSLAWECGAPYVDPGATAFDSCEGDLEVIVENNVDSETPGLYQATYSASDSGDRESVMIREVEVTDTIGPVITMLGDARIEVDCNDEYEEPGAEALDQCGNITAAVLIGGEVDTSTPGVYLLSYEAEDAAGNISVLTREVEVLNNCSVFTHASDGNGDGVISLSELLRGIQLFNIGGYHCAPTPESTEDGFVPGANEAARACLPHSSDFNPQDWVINLSELLRLIQFFNTGGYYECKEATPPTEDGFCVGTPPE